MRHRALSSRDVRDFIETPLKCQRHSDPIALTNAENAKDSSSNDLSRIEDDNVFQSRDFSTYGIPISPCRGVVIVDEAEDRKLES